MAKLTKAQQAELDALRSERETLHTLKAQLEDQVSRLQEQLMEAQGVIADLEAQCAELVLVATKAAAQPKPQPAVAKRSYTPDAAWQADVERKKAIMAAAREQAMRSGRTVRVEV